MRHNAFLGDSISAIGLGTLTWGRDTDDFEAREQIEIFLESGGTLFDTSEKFHPDSLRILNSGLRDRPRSEFQISLHLELKESRRDFIQKFSSALGTLGMDRIEYLVVEPLMEFHMWPRIAQEIQNLYDSQVIDGILFRNISAWKSVSLQSKLSSHVYAGEHFNYSLLETNNVERIEQVACANRKIIATASLASGVLTGKYRSTVPADSRAASPHLQAMTKRFFTPQNLAIVEAAEKAASGLGVSTSAIALSWLQQQAHVTSAIVGPRTAAQLRALLMEVDFELPPAILEALNDVAGMNQA